MEVSIHPINVIRKPDLQTRTSFPVPR